MPAAKRLGKRLFPAVAAVFVALLLTGVQANAQDYHREALRIPFPGLKGRGLEAVLIRPAGKGPYPLALLSHGSSGDFDLHHKYSPNNFYPHAIALARRGYAALVVMRRDYGDSAGPFAEGLGACENPNYLRAAQAGTADLNAAVAAMKKRSDVTIDGMIALGQSAGGFVTVALAAKPPRGMVAAINFAGGLKRERVRACNERQLVSAFGTLGKTSRIPTLWIYSENDQFFPPELARRLHAAFTASGGRAEFIAAPKFRDDGHSFFASAIPQWTVMLDRFLESIGVKRELLPPPAVASLDAPKQMSAAGRESFRRYLESGPHRAFAVSTNGAWAWYWGYRDTAGARAAALEGCTQYAADCKIYAVDDALEPAR